MIKNAQLCEFYQNRHTTIIITANPGGDVRGSSLALVLAPKKWLFSAPTRTIRKFPNFLTQTCLGSTKRARAEGSMISINKSKVFDSTLGGAPQNKGVPRGILGILIKGYGLWWRSYVLNMNWFLKSIYSLSYVVNNDFLVRKLKNWVLRISRGEVIA